MRHTSDTLRLRIGRIRAGAKGVLSLGLTDRQGQVEASRSICISQAASPRQEFDL